MRSTLYYEDYKSERRQVLVDLRLSSDGHSPATAEAGGQPTYSVNGAAYASTSAVLVADDASLGMYVLTFTAAELGTLGTLRLKYDSANTDPYFMEFEVAPNPYLHDGTAQTGTASTITLAAGAAAADDDAYDNGVVWIYDGLGANQMRGVAAYVAATRVVTTDKDWTVTPDNTSKYLVLPSLAPLTGGDLADAVLGRNIAGGSDGGRDVTSALRAIRNQVTLSAITATTATLTVTEEDDSTSAWTAAVTLASGTNPITVINPA
jgi:hypothetical protein